MNEKRKLVARNQWYKFLNIACETHTKPAGTKVTIDSVRFRGNIRRYVGNMVGSRYYNKSHLNEIFGAYIVDGHIPELAGFNVTKIGEGIVANWVEFEFSRGSQSIIDAIFDRMKEFSPFNAIRTDYGFKMKVRIPERKIDLLVKEPKKKKPEIITKVEKDIKEVSTDDLRLQIKQMEAEIKRRHAIELEVMMADYTREREKLVQMNIAIMKIAKEYNMGTEYGERLSTHAL
ncbi:hypothetical protein Aeh1ORF085c [Aeromonas phage Aeh1]|uniref:Uncharacterized protein n=1 Tax=Aeromonas phage Aeh1 TaxID=2880362 RepID=Q76Z00_9CAUD|nr:hypothetical protein Aeh1p091 [Aeromonas phage Aeh1]AAQ17746.1 hypothetical protein Aeh1ORF085c [Aeromonas phage Aeh1]